MIYLIAGKIRSGKTSLITFLGVQNALKKHKIKRYNDTLDELREEGYKLPLKPSNLYANYNIKYDNYRGAILTSTVIQPLDLNISTHVIPDTTICIQEAQLLFNARKFQSLPTEVAEFFQTSGHGGYDIYADAQIIDTVDKVIRSLATIIDVEKRTVFDRFGRKVDYVTRYNFGKIVWNCVEYDTIYQYEKRDGRKVDYVCEFNVFDCYNPWNKRRSFYPEKKGKFV